MTFISSTPHSTRGMSLTKKSVIPSDCRRVIIQEKGKIYSFLYLFSLQEDDDDVVICNMILFAFYRHYFSPSFCYLRSIYRRRRWPRGESIDRSGAIKSPEARLERGTTNQTSIAAKPQMERRDFLPFSQFPLCQDPTLLICVTRL